MPDDKMSAAETVRCKDWLSDTFEVLTPPT